MPHDVQAIEPVSRDAHSRRSGDGLGRTRGPRPDFYDVAAERLIEQGLDPEKVHLAMHALRSEDAEADAHLEPPARARTLWTDPHGATCPVVPFFRHWAYRLLRPICVLGMPLALVVGGAVGDLEGAYAALWGCAALVALIAISLIVPAQHARLAAVRRHTRRLAGGLRFLCPRCLHFGAPQHACGACGEELEEFVVLTRGIYLNDCPHCHTRVFRRGARAGHPPRARCGRCGEGCDVSHHERRVRVIGTLDAEDLRRLSRVPPKAPELGGDAQAWVIDDGETLTYVLDVAGAARDRELDASDAASNVDALWISGAAADPLALGQALDQYVRRTGPGSAAMRGLIILVEAPSLDPVAQNLLETRCTDVSYGVSAAAALNA